MNLWDEVLARIETKINRHSFYTWFKPTTFVGEDAICVTVRVPNPLFKDWLTKHYSVVLNEALSEVRRPGVALVFVAEGAALPVVPPPEDLEPEATVDVTADIDEPSPSACSTYAPGYYSASL